MHSLEERIKDLARALGFELVGIAPATPADGFERLRDWLEHGYAGSMDYMHRHADARRHPASILPEVRSVVMVGMNYAVGGERRAESGERGTGTEESVTESELCEATPDSQNNRRQGGRIGSSTFAVFSSPSTPRSALPASRSPLPHSPARVASYARGLDYHDVLRERLKRLLDSIQQEAPGCRGRAVVDSAPLLERDFARRAGLGWFGKNTMLIHKRLGSFFFLGALLLDLDLRPDAPFEATHCGTCTACLDACPTEAFIGPGQLDARRCISYLTIELRGSVPADLRQPMGDWLFGCDICQDVCPWNHKAPVSHEPAWSARPDLLELDPIEILGLSEDEFRRRFRVTALWRSKRSGLARNAAIILGNRRDPASLPALQRSLTDVDLGVREAAAWAIAQIERKADI